MIIEKPRLPIKDILLYGFLPGPLKKFIYRFKGFAIGRNCHLSLGSVLCGKEVAIGDNTKIGFFTILRGNRISVGSHTSIGSMTFLDVPIIDIGNDCKINEQVFIGGLQAADSLFKMGNNCQIMQMTFINPAVSVTIGDNSGIGGHSLIFGHTSWNSQFEGYPVEFLPIEIGSSVSIAWRVFILPGVKIGDGSVVGPNSLVTRDIPPLALAAGFPARVIRKSPDFPQEITKEDKFRFLKNIEIEMLKYFEGSGLSCVSNNNTYEITHEKQKFWRKRKTVWTLKFFYEDVSQLSSEQQKVHVLVSLKTIPSDIRQMLNNQKTMWLDIEKKERPPFWNDLGDEVALYLRRYGVRFNRVKE